MTNHNLTTLNYFAVAQIQNEINVQKELIYEHLRQQVPTSQNANYGTIDEKEESIMPENNTYTKTEIDLKFQILEQKIDSLPTAFEKMLLKNNAMLDSQAKERQKESLNNLKWFIGIIIAIAGIAIPLILRFFQTK